MTSKQIAAVVIMFAALAVFTATPAQAVQRTHVSAAFGSDANTASNCAAAAPCRFFQAALTVTDNNGEVIVLDSGGYGAVTITQSVALIAPSGVYAGISVFPGANGVTIATAGVNVTLRGITINGQGGASGVLMTAGNKLTVENCFIANLQNGINVDGDSVVRIADTAVRDNTNIGIQLSNGVRATVSRVAASNNNANGVYVLGRISNTTTTVDVADSTFDGNGNVGVYAASAVTTAAVKVSVRESRLTKNAYGMYAQTIAESVKITASNNAITNNQYGMRADGALAKVWASGNTVSDNTITGLWNSGSAIFESAGNNAVRNNATNVVGTITVVPTL